MPNLSGLVVLRTSSRPSRVLRVNKPISWGGIAAIGLGCSPQASPHSASPPTAPRAALPSTQLNPQAYEYDAGRPPAATLPLSTPPPSAEKAVLPDSGFCPEPATIEGVVTYQCAYGSPNFGEKPATDTKDTWPFIVLDHPTDLRVDGGSDDQYECLRDVRMLGFDVLSPSGMSEIVAGKHVRLSVLGYSDPIQARFHARVLVVAKSVDESRPAHGFSIRAVWHKVKKDFMGVPCAGWPRR
jgi:hypothetical protein